MQHTKLLFLLCLTAITLTANAVDPAFTHRITLEIQQNDEYLGNLTLGLFGSVVPKTVMNFYQLSETHYTNTTFHRVIDGFMIQGGDFENHDGTGGYSIYGKSQGSLPDENFTLKHDRVGRLSMANSGPNTAGSQFFITSAPAEFLDGKHVVFGQLIDGFETLGAIQRVAKDIEDRPLTNVTISSVRREVMDDQMDDYTETAKHQNSTPTEGLENTESSQDLKPVLEESLEISRSQNSGDSFLKPHFSKELKMGPPVTRSTEALSISPTSDHKKPNEIQNPGGIKYDSSVHMVLLPFLLFFILLTTMFLKYRNKVLFKVKGPRYRRL